MFENFIDYENAAHKSRSIWKNLFILTAALVVAISLSSCTGPSKKERAEKLKEQADVYYKMGEMQFGQGNYPLALRELHKSEQFDPESTSTQNLLGLSYFARRMYSDAEKHFKKALDIDTTYASARLNLGALYLETSRWDKALKEFDVLLKDVFYTTPELLHNNKGWAYYNKGELKKAIDSYNKAIALNSQYAAAYNNRGLAQEKLKRKKSARKSFKKALEITPTYTDANYNYGRLMIRVNKKKARQLFKKVIELEPDSKMGQSSKEYLNLLKRKK